MKDILRKLLAHQWSLTFFGWLVRVTMKANSPSIGIGAPPYNYAQSFVEGNLPSLINVHPTHIRHIVIIGGYYAFEADHLLSLYPNATITIFEPSPRYWPRLSRRFANEPRVTLVNKAISDADGTITLHQTNWEASDSILELAPSNAFAGLRETDSVIVESVTLDSYLASVGAAGNVDLIWCDVQGAELHVLRGAKAALSRTACLFLEVQSWGMIYDGAATLADITRFVSQYGFVLCVLGLDVRTGMGNSIWIKKIDAPFG